MLPVGEKADAPQVRLCSFPREQHEQLVTHHRAAGRETEFVELCTCAHMGQKRPDVDGAAAFTRDLDVIDPRRVANHQLKRGVDSIIRLAATLVGLDQRRAGAFTDHHQRSGDHRRRRSTGIDENQVDRPLDGDIRRNRDHDAVAGQRGVERERGIVGGHHRAQTLRQHGLVQGQRFRHRANGKAGFETGQVGQLCDEGAVDQHQAAKAKAGEQPSGVLRPRLCDCIGWRSKRLGIPHQLS